MLVRYPETFRWRQLAGAFVLNWVFLGALAFSFPLARWLLLFEGLIYGSALTYAGAQLAFNHRDISLLIGIPVAISIMHFSWGCGFLWSSGEVILKLVVGQLKQISKRF